MLDQDLEPEIYDPQSQLYLLQQEQEGFRCNVQDATKDTFIELFSIQQWGTIHFFQRQWKKSLTFKITRRNVCCGLKCCSTTSQRFNWLQHAEYILKLKTFLWLFWIHWSFSDYGAVLTWCYNIVIWSRGHSCVSVLNIFEFRSVQFQFCIVPLVQVTDSTVRIQCCSPYHSESKLYFCTHTDARVHRHLLICKHNVMIMMVHADPKHTPTSLVWFQKLCKCVCVFCSNSKSVWTALRIISRATIFVGQKQPGW